MHLTRDNLDKRKIAIKVTTSVNYFIEWKFPGKILSPAVLVGAQNGPVAWPDFIICERAVAMATAEIDSRSRRSPGAPLSWARMMLLFSRERERPPGVATLSSFYFDSSHFRFFFIM